MPGLIDTNLLLYAANRNAPQSSAARRFLEVAGLSGEQWYLTEGICYEFLRVATHPRVFEKPLAWKDAMAFLRSFWDCSAFAVLTAGQEHWSLLARELAGLSHPAANLFFDIRIVVLMREHGIRTLYTTDTDFLQFSDITVINPLAG
ncbi:MAG: PIN domain-containing protein [Phycisphaeraceae bacterium]|nr:PIN domain-containing protein [Phycisphaeraceae bacterium]